MGLATCLPNNKWRYNRASKRALSKILKIIMGVVNRRNKKILSNNKIKKIRIQLQKTYAKNVINKKVN